MPLFTWLTRALPLPLAAAHPAVEHRAHRSSAAASTSSGSGSAALSASLLPDLLAACAALHAPFRPSPQLAAGHLQTLYSAVADTLALDAVRYERAVLLLPDGGTLSVDVATAATQRGEREARESIETVVMLHGLTGGSDES